MSRLRRHPERLDPAADRGVPAAGRADPPDLPVQWGWAPWLVLSTTAGLLAVAVGYRMGRAGLPGEGELLFWAGFVAIIAPNAFRLSMAPTSREERIAASVLVGMGLYAVKVLYAPAGFRFGDEFTHDVNTQTAMAEGSLFNPNGVLAVTEFYPGLASATSAVASLTGLSTFAAGVTVVGASRLVLVLALFLMAERMTGSSRVAGLAVVLYAANPNFMFWGAQYAYESLALPLCVTTLYLLARRRQQPDSRWLLFVAALLIPAVTMTHHLTSYALSSILLALAVMSVWFRREPRWTLWLLAGYAVAWSSIWVSFVAEATVPYLDSIFSRAAGSVAATVGNAGAGSRQLFESEAGTVAPWYERGLALSSIAILLALLPVGLRVVARKHRRDPFVVLLAGGAVAFFGTLLLRLAPGAWETGNRASEFLFIGLCVVAASGADAIIVRGGSAVVRAACAVGATIVTAGGLIAGWAPGLRLPQPYSVVADGNVVEPPGVAVARWTRGAFQADERFIADEANGRLLYSIGDQATYVGSYPSVRSLLRDAEYPSWQPETLRRLGVRYALVDRRRIAWDNMAGYYFSSTTPGSQDYFPPAVFEKYERLGADRLLDGGDIAVYDLNPLLGVPRAAN